MITGLIFLQLSNDQAGLINMGFILAMFAVFWLFFIRPQSRKQKSQNTFVDDLSKGDKVVTSSGILGKITAVENNVVSLEIAKSTTIRVTKNAISKELTDAIYAADKPIQKN